MSANINKTNGKASIFTTAATWHGLESQVSQPSTSEEVIKLAGLDYTVEKKELYTPVEEEYVIVPDKYATIRTDTNVPLGVVGERYNVLQNTDAFKFIDEIVGKKDAIFQSAGALGKGEKIWLSVKLPEVCVVGNDDIAEHYFFLSNSHDGSRSVELGFTNIFIVCENTMKMALSSAKKKKRVRHTASVNTKLIEAADLMGITRQRVQQLQKTYNAMSKVDIKDTQLRRFIEIAMKPEAEYISKDEFSTRFKNIVDNVYAYSVGDSAQQLETRKGTLFGALNGVTGYYNNVITYDTPEKKLNSIMFGNTQVVQQRAFDLALSVLTEEYTLQ